MEHETILFDVAEHVATITLNRPDSLNSFNNAMAIDMTWAWETVRETDDIHCVVLQANGDRAFGTGTDIKNPDPWFMKENAWNSFDPGVSLSPKLHHKVWKPVVCAVHGLCAGGAQYFVNESDIVICSDDAAFFDPHANVGIVERTRADGDAAPWRPARGRTALGPHGERGAHHRGHRPAPRPGHRGGDQGSPPGARARRSPCPSPAAIRRPYRERSGPFGSRST